MPPSLKPYKRRGEGKDSAIDKLLGEDGWAIGSYDYCSWEACVKHLTLPDYLYEAYYQTQTDANPSPDAMMTTVTDILMRKFLGDLGERMEPCIDRLNHEARNHVINAESLRIMLNLWVRLLSEEFKQKYIRNDAMGNNDSNGEENGDVVEEKDDDDDDPDYDDQEMHDEGASAEEEEEELVFDNSSSDEESDDEDVCNTHMRRGFYQQVMEYCDRHMAENLTVEERQQIDRLVGTGNGNIDAILNAQPIQTGAEEFDKMFPIPPRECCLDPFEMLPFFTAGLMCHFGRIGYVPILSLEAMCLLTKAMSAVLFKIYGESYKTLQAKLKDQENEIQQLKQELEATKQELEKKKGNTCTRGNTGGSSDEDGYFSCCV